MLISYKSARFTHYAVSNEELLRRVLEDFERERKEKSIGEPIKIPKDLLEDVVGHDDVKELVIRVLKSKSRNALLLWGPPASAKSMIMEAIWKGIKGSYMVLAGTTTRAGLREIIAESTPRILLIDELDKVGSPRDLSVLLSWIENNRIMVAMHRKYEVVECPYPDGCKVIAGANDITRIPRELRSRFIIKRIPEYREEQVIEICRHILSKREGLTEELSEYIGKQVVEKLRSKDPRDCVKIARILD